MLGRRDAGGCHAAQFGHDTGPHVQDVRGALGHVAAQVVQHFRDGRACLPDGALAGRSAADQLGRGLEQHRVGGHEGGRLQYSLSVAAGGLRPRLQLVVYRLGCRFHGRGGFLGG